MQIIRISPRGFGANTYVITKDGKNAVVIDPAQPRVAQELEKLALTPAYVLLTHCHFDHVAGVEILQEKGAKVFCSTEEKPLIGTSADLFEYFGAPRLPFVLDGTFFDNEEKELCGITVKALLTPGHTKGSVCYLFTEKDGGRYLFTGDTLFQGSIGRTDFPTGNMGEMQQSLRRLSALEDSLPIYPGHNDESTIGIEKRENPFMER
jgi:glyoxylase-like metal-dependent hydrolase (beta-lactamase superfamily II)